MNTQVERWGPGLQERNQRRPTSKRPIPKSGRPVDFKAPLSSSTSTNSLLRPQPVAPFCRLSPLGAAEVGPVEALANRYLAGALQHPTLVRLLETKQAEVVFKVTGIDKIESSATTAAAEWGNKKGLIVKKVVPHVDIPELVRYGGHIYPQLATMTSEAPLSSADGPPSSWLSAKLPYVFGYYFSNTYPTTTTTNTTTDDGNVVSLLERALVMGEASTPEEGTLLLCNVAVGRMCMNDRSVTDGVLQAANTLQAEGASPSSICDGLMDTLANLQAAASTAITAPPLASCGRPTTSGGMSRPPKGGPTPQATMSTSSSLSSAIDGGGGGDQPGYDSLVCSIEGTPNTLIFDGSRIVPTHVIRFRCTINHIYNSEEMLDDRLVDPQALRRPGTAMSSTPSQWGNSSRPNSQMYQQRPATALSPKKNRLGTTSRSGSSYPSTEDAGSQGRMLTALKEDIKRSSHAASAHVRQQCKDLIDALCAKRESILASVRSQEEGLLRDVVNLESELTTEPSPLSTDGELSRRQGNIVSAATQLKGLRLSVVDSMREINRLSIAEIRRNSAIVSTTSSGSSYTHERSEPPPPFVIPSTRPQTSPTPFNGTNMTANVTSTSQRRATQVTAALNGRLRKPPTGAKDLIRSKQQQPPLPHTTSTNYAEV